MSNLAVAIIREADINDKTVFVYAYGLRTCEDMPFKKAKCEKCNRVFSVVTWIENDLICPSPLCGDGSFYNCCFSPIFKKGPKISRRNYVQKT